MVIRDIPSDPSMPVIAGEQMRAAAMAGGVHAGAAPEMGSLVMGGANMRNVDAWPIVSGERGYAPMIGGQPVPRSDVLRDPYAGTMIAANAVIATPCGAIYPMERGGILLPLQNAGSQRWAVSGVTRDNAGAALGNCRVIVMDVGQQFVGGPTIVGETVSDGGGNYSVSVPLNTAYQAIAYRPGSPDVAGATVNTVIPAANG